MWDWKFRSFFSIARALSLSLSLSLIPCFVTINWQHNEKWNEMKDMWKYKWFSVWFHAIKFSLCYKTIENETFLIGVHRKWCKTMKVILIYITIWFRKSARGCTNIKYIPSKTEIKTGERKRVNKEECDCNYSKNTLQNEFLCHKTWWDIVWITKFHC